MEDTSTIPGNAPPHIKEIFADLSAFFRYDDKGKGSFGDSIARGLRTTEVSIIKKAEEPMKDEARVVCEITVQEDMLNGGGNIHGGCSAFLIDLCSTLSLTALMLSSTGSVFPNVSQSLNVVYHSPAGLGDKLRLVNTTMTVGARALSARTEIWNVTHHRLVASGVHIKMQPSMPKANL
ncbi:hypothetical protein BD779DRAFT_658574 [Infundibulicybe gibba]|nr:hypothetical protein BD779DRAFT_658574 [Infundibulicybe gibba]